MALSPALPPASLPRDPRSSRQPAVGAGSQHLPPGPAAGQLWVSGQGPGWWGPPRETQPTCSLSLPPAPVPRPDKQLLAGTHPQPLSSSPCPAGPSTGQGASSGRTGSSSTWWSSWGRCRGWGAGRPLGGEAVLEASGCAKVRRGMGVGGGQEPHSLAWLSTRLPAARRRAGLLQRSSPIFPWSLPKEPPGHGKGPQGLGPPVL